MGKIRCCGIFNYKTNIKIKGGVIKLTGSNYYTIIQYNHTLNIITIKNCLLLIWMFWSFGIDKFDLLQFHLIAIFRKGSINININKLVTSQ